VADRAGGQVRPRVVVMSLGGTIAMTGEPGSGVAPRLDGPALVRSVPGLGVVADVEARSFRQLPGASLRLDDLYALAEEVEETLDGGAAGVVITQGTDTIEETAYCLDLLLDRPEPVVVTGAMRNPTLAGADGPANLLASVVVASSGEALGGVVVVLEDQVHSARLASKQHSVSPGAFGSPGAGSLGLVAENRLLLHARPVPKPFAVDRVVRNPTVSVPIITVGLDDDGRALAATEGADAVVLEALGVGHVPQWLVPEVAKVAARVPVVMTSRTRSGPVLHATYGFPGSEQDLRRNGVLGAGSLGAMKARILLMVLLRSGLGPAELGERLSLLDHPGRG
jgi:L-asparaginase